MTVELDHTEDFSPTEHFANVPVLLVGGSISGQTLYYHSREMIGKMVAGRSPPMLTEPATGDFHDVVFGYSPALNHDIVQYTLSNFYCHWVAIPTEIYKDPMINIHSYIIDNLIEMASRSKYGITT